MVRLASLSLRLREAPRQADRHPPPRHHRRPNTERSEALWATRRPTAPPPAPATATTSGWFRSVRRLLGIKNVSYNEATACLGVTLDPNGSWDDVHRHIIDLIEADLGHTVSIHMEPSTIHED
jgi:hypothetical protein